MAAVLEVDNCRCAIGAKAQATAGQEDWSCKATGGWSCKAASACLACWDWPPLSGPGNAAI